MRREKMGQSLEEMRWSLRLFKNALACVCVSAFRSDTHLQLSGFWHHSLTSDGAARGEWAEPFCECYAIDLLEWYPDAFHAILHMHVVHHVRCLSDRLCAGQSLVGVCVCVYAIASAPRLPTRVQVDRERQCLLR